ncbi:MULTISPECIES: DUF5388 domain-containing protein [Enterococcus]|uniref:DUF5388 domain-containing protein n=1 Tax=Enterococcus TaxID=1350 RepID=UPI003F27EDB1
MVKKFTRDPNRKTTKDIPKTKLSEPVTTFDIENFQKENQISETTKKTVGRPRKNKIYSTIRLQKHNVNRINSLQNTLNYETQDDLISALLNRLENSISQEQRTMFNMYMKTYENRDKKNR